MNKNEFRKSLEDLRKELHQTESLDENSKEQLIKLKNEIEKVLETSENYSTEQRDTLMGSLKDSVAQFEGTHPRLAESMHIVIHTLSNMGI
jgi:predicted  nucleic acid-binding Zn-ribbon protein